VRDRQFGYPTFVATGKWDGKSRTIGGYPAAVFPYCVLVDAQGKVAAHGPLSEVTGRLRAESRLATLAAALGPAALFAAEGGDRPPDVLIGYTEYRTDLPGGRHANIKTRRAVVVKADGTGRRVLAEELTREAGYSTEFGGWSPDGKAARL